MRSMHNLTQQGSAETLQQHGCGALVHAKSKKKKGKSWHRERPGVTTKFDWKPGQTKFKLPKPKTV